MSELQEVELTADLLDYAEKCAYKEARKHCPKFVRFEDVAQEALLTLLKTPPMYDPSKGASVKTLIYTIVQRVVLKYSGKEKRDASRFKQVVATNPSTDDERDGKLSEPRSGTVTARGKIIDVQDAEAADNAGPRRDKAERRPSDLTRKSATTDDIFEFIHDEESREWCRLFIECNCNISEVARRLDVVEGTVRHRLKVLGPKLRAVGFNPYPN